MSSSLLVAENLLFDSRLALFHCTERWLAIADLHYGYELSLRASGALFPDLGMGHIEQNVASLVTDYRPEVVLFLGDLVHTPAATAAFKQWLATLAESIPQLILIRGNHDRRLKTFPLHDHWRSGSQLFHHGHESIETKLGDIVFSGHLHPAHFVSDQAGFHQNLPALCRTSGGWILPAFSPWAAGGVPIDVEILDRWVSNQKKIWRVK
ncbi:MAG: metallophosphoesterase [Chthoniobacterales bacterium]